jgi:IPT/TIG domain
VSSDGSYLWVGLDGAGTVQRFQLPSLTSDISFSIPKDFQGNAQQAISLEAARISPHTVAMVAGHFDYSPPGNGVYVYDDATPRAASVLGWGPDGGPEIDWVQWGNDDSTLFGTTSYNAALQPMKVTSSGISLNGTREELGSIYGQYVPQEGLLYSYGGAYDPVKATQAGQFNIIAETGAANAACTADASLGRYYCAVSFPVGDTDVEDFQMWVYDLNTYALLNVVDFGISANGGAQISGWFQKLVRWGNAGLALSTTTDPAGYKGKGGLFLIDGAAVNASAAPDVSSGSSTNLLSYMSSLSPQSTKAGSADLNLTITGQNFSPDSTACWNCHFQQFNFLPTTYVSPTELNVTIPASVLATADTISIAVFDANSNSFGLTALPFTILAPPVSSSTTVSVLDLSGLDMAWDADRQLLYVATADYDPVYPNSIVSLNPASATVSKTQFVGSDPAFLSISAGGQYLYVGYDGATNEIQLALPGLDSPLTWTLANATAGSAFLTGDLKAAPQSPDLTAVTLIDPNVQPEGIGGVVIFNDSTMLQDTLAWYGPGPVGNVYVALAWGDSDAVLTATADEPPLYTIAVNSSGATFLNAYQNGMNGDIHSDFGTGLIYSDDGKAANPVSGAIVGTYNASGLLVPDSTLNRVFIFGQTNSQSGTNNFTIESFDQKALTPVSSITLNGLSGSPFSMVRWGNSGLAVLTTNGLLYIVQDSTFVSSSNAPNVGQALTRENVKMLWNKPSKLAISQALRQRGASAAGQNPFTLTQIRVRSPRAY